MPKFIFTVVIAALFAWAGTAYIVMNTPTELVNILKFLAFAFAALSLSGSIPAYFLVRKKHSEMMDQRMLYRKSLKWSMFVAFGITGMLLLKAFSLLTIMNVVLFLVFYAAIFAQVRTKK